MESAVPLRVLYLPHGRRRRYFADLFAAGVARRGWQIGVLAPAADRSAYPFVMTASDHLEVPDFAMDAAAGVGTDNATAALIAAAERATATPASRLILANERDIGRGFGRPFFHFPERREVAAVLADNTLPMRIVKAVFARMSEALAAFRPDIVVTGNVAAAHHMALVMVARLRGVPVLIGRPSKIHADRSFWTSDLAMTNDAVAGHVAAQTSRGSSPPHEAFRYVTAFREKPRTIAYIARTWRAGAAESWISRHRYFTELAYLHLKHAVLRRRGIRPKPLLPSILEYYQTAWRAQRQYRFFVRPAPQELARMRYVYLALHKEPELAINFQAVAWRNQYETAAKLAAALPCGGSLIVREHRFNRGRRPGRFYADLAALPNTIIADPFDDQFKYIVNADVVVTDNGSTGWEGLLLGRPVITLDRAFYDAAGMAHPVYEPARLGETLLRLWNDAPPPVDDADLRLARLVAAEFATTTPDEGEEGLAANLEAIETAAGHSRGGQRRGAAE